MICSAKQYRGFRNGASGKATRRMLPALVAAVTLLGLATGAASGQADGQAASPGGTAVQSAQQVAEKLVRRGAEYLIASQESDGGWASRTGPGVSGLAVKALIQAPSVGPQHPAVKRGLEFIKGFQRENGGIYAAGSLHQNYETSVALSAFSAANLDEYRKLARDAQIYLRNGQWDEGEDKSVDDPWYGGAGYGSHGRPDLSNTQMMIEALHDSGLPKDDPAYAKALKFIERCQMYGETNDMPFAKGATQGGFIYSPANGGETKAGTIEIDGREELRCYGSMTYAAFKSMVYCGLERDDPRVKAALDWIRSHWTLDYNPNMPESQSKQGLYYYFHVFGRAMQAWGEDKIKDQQGREHDWRAELVRRLAELQRDDGSWVNDADRWMEGLPPLTTAYSMLALEAALDADPVERK